MHSLITCRTLIRQFIVSPDRRFSLFSNICLKGQYERSVKTSRPNKQIIRHFAYEGDGKTVAVMLNREQDVNLLIDSYSNYGFRLNNNLFVLGPLAIFPRTVLQWNVKSVDDINEDSLSLFYVLEPKIDILVLGIGDPENKLKAEIIRFLRHKKINIEVLPTYHACTTYNYLTLENRCVAAALIPPTVMTITDKDIIDSRNRQKLLAEED